MGSSAFENHSCGSSLHNVWHQLFMSSSRGKWRPLPLRIADPILALSLSESHFVKDKAEVRTDEELRLSRLEKEEGI